MTLGITAYDLYWHRQEALASFRLTSVNRLAAVQRAHELNLAHLQGVGALFFASEKVTSEEFARFIDFRRAGPRLYQALEFAARVPAAERRAFESAFRRQTGLVSAGIWENAPDGKRRPAEERSEYFPVAFVEPSAGNEAVYGFDLASDPTRRAALTRAVDSGEPVMSDPVALIQDGGTRHGFLIFEPIYAQGSSLPATTEERRQTLRGLVVGAYVFGVPTEAALKGTEEPFAQNIFMFASSDPGARPVYIHRAPGASRQPAPPLADAPTRAELLGRDGIFQGEVHIAGRMLTLVFVPGESFGLARWFDRGNAGFMLLMLAFTAAIARYSRRTQKANRARAAAERYNRSLLEQLPIGISLCRMDGTIVDANPAFAAILDRPVAEVLGLTFWQLTPEESAPLERERFEVLKASGRYGPFEKDYLRADGGRVPVRLHRLLVEQNGEQRILATVEDISERMAAEQRVLDSEKILQAMIASSQDAFVAMDVEGRIIEWSSQAERLFGWRDSEILGGTLHDLIAPLRYREAFRHGLQTFLGGGAGPILNRPREIEAQRRDGSEFPVELMVTAVRLDTGWRFSAFIRDISRRKQTEERLRQAQKMDAIGQLTGGLAHDFNNLLGIIIGNLDLVLLDLPEPGEPRHSIEVALAAAMRGADLTRRLLAFARREQLGHRQPVKLRAVLAEMTPLLNHTLGCDIRLETRIEGQPVIDADPGELESALMNLAVNARDAMPNGGRFAIDIRQVVLEGETAVPDDLAVGAYILLSVSDTGCGMSREVRERALEPFFTTKGRGRGTGLGLAMVYGFAQQSGGALRLYSEPGHGTTFKIFLPLSTASSVAEMATEQSVSFPQQGTEAILAVDDEPEMLAVAARWLGGLGYRVVTATNAREALAWLETGEPVDLLFTDAVMPGMDGIQLARRARELRPGLRILLTSGFTDSVLAEHSALTLHHVLLDKPYRRPELAQAVRQVLDADPEETL
jgi:PAS domain S-box-containing protein